MTISRTTRAGKCSRWREGCGIQEEESCGYARAGRVDTPLDLFKRIKNTQMSDELKKVLVVYSFNSYYDKAHYVIIFI